MPQFAIHTFPSQLFWLAISLTFLLVNFYFFIIPRYKLNQNLRKGALLHIHESIEKLENEMRILHNKSEETWQEAEKKAKEMFNTARHTLDQEDHALRMSMLKEERERLQYHLNTYDFQSTHAQENIQKNIPKLKSLMTKYLQDVVK